MRKVPSVRLVGVSKRYDKDILALDNVSLKISDGEYVTILGPSGCGKTTLLKSIAGIVIPTSGKIFIGGQLVNDVPIEDRGVGYVFQNYALFPHLSVGGNASYGPIVKGRDHADAERVGREMLDLVRLLDRRDSLPEELSGGMQQRVAIARALASDSRLLLLDEPLGALDAKTRVILRDYVRDLAKKLGLTAIHVTHDQAEAMAVSDRIILMKKGRIVQVGRPEALYFLPETPFAANFVGECNFFEGTISGKPARRKSRSHASAHVQTRCGLTITVSRRNRQKSSKQQGLLPGSRKAAGEGGGGGGRLVLGVRPENIRLESVGTSAGRKRGRTEKEKDAGGANRFPGTIKSRMFSGSLVKYKVLLLVVDAVDSKKTGATISVTVPFSGERDAMPKLGESVVACFDAGKVFVFDFPQGGREKELELE